MPPVKVSVPAPPYSRSSPVPPKAVSSPAPPYRTSLPSRPWSVSPSAPPSITSSPDPPVMVSLPAPPAKVSNRPKGVLPGSGRMTLSLPPSASEMLKPAATSASSVTSSGIPVAARIATISSRSTVSSLAVNSGSKSDAGGVGMVGVTTTVSGVAVTPSSTVVASVVAAAGSVAGGVSTTTCAAGSADRMVSRSWFGSLSSSSRPASTPPASGPAPSPPVPNCWPNGPMSDWLYGDRLLSPAMSSAPGAPAAGAERASIVDATAISPSRPIRPPSAAPLRSTKPTRVSRCPSGSVSVTSGATTSRPNDAGSTVSPSRMISTRAPGDAASVAPDSTISVLVPSDVVNLTVIAMSRSSFGANRLGRPDTRPKSACPIRDRFSARGND